MSYLEILLTIRQLTPVVREIVGAIVKLLATSDDPEADARRALEELARVRGFDELMRHRGKR